MSYIDLDTKIQFLKGVGPKVAEKLHKIGVYTYHDLLFLFPRKYFDYSNVTSIETINEHPPLEEVTIRGNIVGIANKTTKRRNFKVTEAVVEDGTGSIKVVWFNQVFLTKMLPAGTEVILNGKVRYDYFSHSMVMESPQRSKSAKIVPIYPETQGFGSAYIRNLIRHLESKIPEVAEFLPDNVRGKYKLLNIQDAISALHFPEDNKGIAAGRKRMAFDELFFIALQANLSKEELKHKNSPEIKIEDEKLKAFTETLPFTLTKDQKMAAWKIICEMQGNRPMNRLLNGDVGSGKTVVAAFAAYVSVLAGYKVALMAPTEILAVQHFETFSKLLEPFGIKIGLFTASSKSTLSSQQSAKKTANNKLRSTNIDVYIGTQALLHLKEPIENLGLVIIDEQHRFGVKQRAQLLKMTNFQFPIPNELSNVQIPKNTEILKQVQDDNEAMKQFNNEKVRPHFLSMTATPIPRTLQLALFGDLDVSIIKTMPAGRKAIITRLALGGKRDDSYHFIREQVKSGRQVFVICPLIEDTSDKLLEKSQNLEGETMSMFEEEKKSVLVEYEKLSKDVFPDLRIGMLHGKMKSKEKNEVMDKFSNAEYDILVSTSVVEVGVNIPNATIMMIEDAEKFGLAQLHQFRGRVGRAEHQSYCLLFTNSRSEKAIKRLESFERTLDGFELAQTDLETRGPGQIFGTMQSGVFDLKMASFSDIQTISEASEGAKAVIAEDPDLKKYPELKKKLADYINSKHFE